MAFYLQAMHSLLYVEVKDAKTEEGTPVIVAEYHGKKRQQWKYLNGKIVSRLSDLVLDVHEDGKTVITSAPNETPNQKWAFAEDMTIVNDLGKALDVRGGSKEPGAEIIVWNKNGEKNQQFRVVPMNKIK